MIAEGRDIDTGTPGRLQYRSPFIYFDLDMIDGQIHTFLPRMGDGPRLAGQHTRQVPLPFDRLTRGTSVFDLLSLFLRHRRYHGIGQGIQIVGYHLQDSVGTSGNTLATAVAFFRVDGDEILPGAVFIAVVR
jgi:hypothetical protein